MPATGSLGRNKNMMIEQMETDIQYRDYLRQQRDNWLDIMNYLESSPNFNEDEKIQRAFKLAKREYNRILESLQD